MTLPNFQEERKLWRKSFGIVIGVDEVGRGSWAGPVVAAAVAFNFALVPVGLYPHPTSATPHFSSLEEILKLGINDSKALSSQKRVKLADIIKECSLWALGEIGVSTINRVGIGKATEMAMRKALRRFVPQGKPPVVKTFILIDAFHIKYLQGIGLKNQKAIIKGDQKSISIAAASILAKVYRDNLMKKLSKKYPRYGWGKSKGYGTKEHQEAILKYGMTRLHRKVFVETFLGRKK